MIAFLISQFPTFFKYRFWIGFAFLLILIPIAYGWGYWSGYNTGKARVEYRTIEKIIEVEKQHEKKKQEIRKLDNDALRKRFCQWVYDIPYDQCVRTYNFVE